MAYGVLMDFASGSNDAYDRVIEAMGLTDGRPPSHALFHMAGPTDSGFRVVDIWESVEEFQKFAEEKIGPLANAEGFPPPTVSIWELHNTMEREGERVLARG
jgi:hypothetical protein